MYPIWFFGRDERIVLPRQDDPRPTRFWRYLSHQRPDIGMMPLAAGEIFAIVDVLAHHHQDANIDRSLLHVPVVRVPPRRGPLHDVVPNGPRDQGRGEALGGNDRVERLPEKTPGREARGGRANPVVAPMISCVS